MACQAAGGLFHAYETLDATLVTLCEFPDGGSGETPEAEVPERE
jgi:putative hemolysin